jgi:hypothetical protein
LKSARRPARARIVAAEFFEQRLVAVDDAVAALDPGFGRETLAALTRDFESKG